MRHFLQELAKSPECYNCGYIFMPDEDIFVQFFAASGFISYTPKHINEYKPVFDLDKFHGYEPIKISKIPADVIGFCKNCI